MAAIATKVYYADLWWEKDLWDLIERLCKRLPFTPEQFAIKFEARRGKWVKRTKRYLKKRAEYERKIKEFWLDHKDQPKDDALMERYEAFLREIGYIVAEPEEVTVGRDEVMEAFGKVHGPQLVLPAGNDRFMTNSPRWGSLYDALYGSNLIPDEGETVKDLDGVAGNYNPARGKAVEAYMAAHLDKVFTLTEGSHTDVVEYYEDVNAEGRPLQARLKDGSVVGLKDPSQYVGHRGDPRIAGGILLRQNDIDIELMINRSHKAVGALHPAGIYDVESGGVISAIFDIEDSEQTVDLEDEMAIYLNLTRFVEEGDQFTAIFEKDGVDKTRGLPPDRDYIGRDGEKFSLRDRTTWLIRHRGLHMWTSSVTDEDGGETPAGMLDLYITTLICMVDNLRPENERNCRFGRMYFVKPKLHGPFECAFVDEMFACCEMDLGLDFGTIRLGVMDEERRTTVNLMACIAATSKRVVFINTGFLDRTGDEIHTDFHAGPMQRKDDIKAGLHISSYEVHNVWCGVNSGMTDAQNAQIGKGMWPKPDDMAGMMATKGGHVDAGANTAWTPSKLAAVLHALHYQERDNVSSIQEGLRNSERPSMRDLLYVPLLELGSLTPEEIAAELDNNNQAILGYTVRWVEGGVGCSKVPDIHDVGLMEDRATLRINSQHVANWLYHEVVTQAEVDASLARMAAKVDEQNVDTDGYVPMTGNDDSLGMKAAKALIERAEAELNGYTEPTLHEFRAKAKLAEAA